FCQAEDGIRDCHVTGVQTCALPIYVCDAVDPPKPGEADMYVMSAEEARRLEEACKGVRLGPLVILALHTGMRLGELLGLKWSDIEGEELHVRRTLVKYGQEPVFGTPKNGRVR